MIKRLLFLLAVLPLVLLYGITFIPSWFIVAIFFIVGNPIHWVIYGYIDEDKMNDYARVIILWCPILIEYLYCIATDEK